MKNNLTYLVKQLLTEHSVLIDFEELSFQIHSHPSYPSLHAVTDVLVHFNIENVAVKVPVDTETLEQLPNCFLAEIEKSTIKKFAVVNKVNDGYQLVYDNKRNEYISETLFLEHFTGVLVTVEMNEKGTVKIKSNYIDSLKLLSGIALLIFIFYTLTPSLVVSLHFLLSILGAVISYFIVQEELGMSSNLVDKICSQENKINNCNAILKSKGSLLFKVIKLSNICIIYFTGISITCLLLMLSSSTYLIVFFISVLTFPAIIYSIYLQYVIERKWCLLCLGIVAILSLQIILSIFSISAGVNFMKIYLSLSILLLVFLITSVVWLFVISKLKVQIEYNLLKIESTKFKRNYTVFRNLLFQNEMIDTLIVDAKEIVFGNKKALLEVVVITNPFCNFCKETHDLIEALLKKNKEQISIIVRFNINIEDKDSELVKVTMRLLKIYNEEGEESCLKAMREIYNKHDIEGQVKPFDNSEKYLEFYDVLLKESRWCIEHQINFTPTLLVNGFLYPKEYKKGDIVFFIHDLYEDVIKT
ncbi:vitamin K epoxide reductase family protein [Lacinutrix undariae]